MKLASIICESMTWDDLDGQTISGHRLVHFDPSPATFSAQSLWLMQTKINLPPPVSNPHVGESWFKGTDDLISLKYSTRLISNFWPTKFDPIRIDPLIADRQGETVGIEPNCHQWNTLMSYFNGPMPHEWLIYWPTIGHAQYRIGEENKGIPNHIRETAKSWFNLVMTMILPKLNCKKIIFSDHGSARKDKTSAEQFANGFAFIDEAISGIPDRMTWVDMRKLQESILCS